MTDTLTVEGLSVQFAGLKVLTGLSVAVHPGEVLGVLGPNGAGKTTLVNAITGFVRPTAGSIRLGDRELTGRSSRAIARAGISRSFQATRLFPRLTVSENIEVAALGTGAWPRVARRRAEELIGVLRLDDVSDVAASALPYGLERRVAIARASAASPRCLLLDEPAAGMTPQEADALVEDIERARDHLGCSVLLIEHDVPFVLRISHRAVVLHQGSIIAEGPAADVVRRPEVLEAYFGLKPADAPTVRSS